MKNIRFGILKLFSRRWGQLSTTLHRAIPLALLGLSFALVAPNLTAAPAPGECALNSARGQIKHVIYIQFDNVHFRRDNPNVPPDLEQMPHLLNFLTSNGTLLAKPSHPTVAFVQVHDIIASGPSANTSN